MTRYYYGKTTDYSDATGRSAEDLRARTHDVMRAAVEAGTLTLCAYEDEDPAWISRAPRPSDCVEARALVCDRLPPRSLRALAPSEALAVLDGGP